MAAIIINASNLDYSIGEVLSNRSTMTVGELVNLLKDFNEDMPIVLSFSNGYTYGPLTMGSIEQEDEE